MKVSVIQTNPVFGEINGNITDAISLMDSVKADLYILPELFATGYNFKDKSEVMNMAESVDGQTFRALHTWAKKNSKYIVYGFAELADDLYNSATLIGSNGVIGLYRKVHLFDKEHNLFAPGNLGFPVFDLPFGKIGMMICFDWIYPESVRSLVLKEAQLIAHPANLVLPYCPDAMITRCLENRVFTATANRVGEENRGECNLKFIGSSEIVSPDGRILKRLSTNKESAAVVEIDLKLALNKKINKHNDVIMGRRIDQY